MSAVPANAQSPVSAGGPAATLLAATVARRYYLDGASKSDIASEVGLSRFKVARMLDQARESGLVRIELHYEGEIDLDLSVRLGQRLGLVRCLVVDTPDGDEAHLREAIGRVVSDSRPSDVLGLAWSRTGPARRASAASP